MNPRELVDHIRSGPTELVLREPLRFRRRTRSNPCDFNDKVACSAEIGPVVSGGRRDTSRSLQCPIANSCMRTVTRSEATAAIQAVASAIRLDQNLEHLTLEIIMNGFTNEAGVALAVNTTLRKIKLSTATLHPSQQARNRATLGAPAYEALSAMLRVNTSLVLKLPPFETAGADERLCESRNRLRIEQRWNKVVVEDYWRRARRQERSMSMPCTS
jgi:hypothetical protein